MGLSSCLTQLALVTFFLIITNLCPVALGQSNTGAPDTGTTPNNTPISSKGATEWDSSSIASDEPTGAPTTVNNNCTPTTPRICPTTSGTFGTAGYVVISGFSVIGLLVVFVLIPLMSITMDRMYSGRKQETYKLNRTDRFGAQLQRMSPGIHLELQGDGSVGDDSVLMMPEQAMLEPPAQPVSADQTTHLTEDATIVTPCGINQAAVGHYEECKFARASAEILDGVMDMSNLDETKKAIQSTHNADALIYRSHSAANPSTNQQKPTVRLYSNPEKDRKGRDSPQDAPADMKFNISTAGMDDSRVPVCSATPFVREESVDMYGLDSPTPADCKNESFIHSPTASAVVAHHEKMERPTDRPPGCGPHVYEELKEMRAVNETAPAEATASKRDNCKITFPQYFQLNDRAIEDVRATAGYMKPRTAHSLPRRDVQNSLALLLTSPLNESAEGGDNLHPVRARCGTGIMAVVNQQRLSDRALDGAEYVHEANPYNSLKREIVPSMVPYSKLNRGPSAGAGSGTPKTPSINVYNKLKLAADCEFTGQESQFHETRL